MSDQQTPAPVTPPAPAEPPAWLAATPYQTPEALVQGYKNAQAELTRLKQQVTQPAQPVQPQQPAQSQAPSFDWTNPTKYLGDQGFDPGLVDHLSKSGIPKEIVEGFGKDILSARKIVQQQAQAKAVEIAGGADKWQAVQQYIGNMQDAGRKAALMGALDNANTYEYTLRGLVAEMQATGAFNQQPQRQEPNALPNVTTTRLGAEPLMPGSQELSEAIRDPRYRADGPAYNPAYAKEVEQRIMAGQKLMQERMAPRR